MSAHVPQNFMECLLDTDKRFLTVEEFEQNLLAWSRENPETLPPQPLPRLKARATQRRQLACVEFIAQAPTIDTSAAADDDSAPSQEVVVGGPVDPLALALPDVDLSLQVAIPLITEGSVVPSDVDSAPPRLAPVPKPRIGLKSRSVPLPTLHSMHDEQDEISVASLPVPLEFSAGPVLDDVLEDEPKPASKNLPLGYAQLLAVIKYGTGSHLEAFLRFYGFYYQQQNFSPAAFINKMTHADQFSRTRLTAADFKEICTMCGLGSLVELQAHNARQQLLSYMNDELAALKEKTLDRSQSNAFEVMTSRRRRKDLLETISQMVRGLGIVEAYIRNPESPIGEESLYKLRLQAWHTLSFVQGVLQENDWTGGKNGETNNSTHHYMNAIRYEQMKKSIAASKGGFPAIPALKPGFGPFKTTGYFVAAAAGLTFSAIFGYCAFFAAVALSVSLALTPAGWVMAGIALAVCSVFALTCLCASLYLATRPVHSMRSHGRLTGPSTDLKHLQEKVAYKAGDYLSNQSTVTERFSFAFGQMIRRKKPKVLRLDHVSAESSA